MVNGNVLTYEERLRDLCMAKKFEEALILVLEEEKKQPGIHGIIKAKSALLGKLGRQEESIEAANKAIEIDPKDFESYGNKGVSLYYLGKYEESLRAFDACLDLKPNYLVAIQKKISALTLLGRFSEAAKTYEENDLPEVKEEYWLNNLGFMYAELNDHAKAISFLLRARRVNPFESAIYYNLARLHWRVGNYVRYFLNQTIFIVLIKLEKIRFFNKTKKRFGGLRPHVSEASFFNGPGTLFSSGANVRETKAILKLLRGWVNAMALCNETWKWFAVNVPYNTIEDNGIEGDMDIILKRPRILTGSTYDAGFTYRGFQVKTTVVDRFGNIKSAKRSVQKHRKIKKQLDVLKKFGCEQIFMLELFILERGYSMAHNFPSKEIAWEIIKKANYLKRLGYGYVVIAEEPSPTHDDESGGMVHMPINVLPATNNPIGQDFQKLVDGIDNFLSLPSTKSEIDKLPHENPLRVPVGYCRGCKKLTKLVPMRLTSHVCLFCKYRIY